MSRPQRGCPDQPRHGDTCSQSVSQRVPWSARRVPRRGPFPRVLFPALEGKLREDRLCPLLDERAEPESNQCLSSRMNERSAWRDTDGTRTTFPAVFPESVQRWEAARAGRAFSSPSCLDPKPEEAQCGACETQAATRALPNGNLYSLFWFFLPRPPVFTPKCRRQGTVGTSSDVPFASCPMY